MPRRWIGCHPSNFRIGRPAGLRPEMIVLHSASGTLADATRAFFTPESARSAHYVVGRDGSIAHHVEESDTAFHAGLKINPTAPLVVARPTVNPNYYSIGLEHEGWPDDRMWPDAQIRSSAALIGQITARWRIPLDAAHVVTHQTIRASANCPGGACDVNALLALASPAIGESILDTVVQVRLTARANIRRAPDTSAEAFTVVQPGMTFDATGFARGQPVGGNEWWYVDGEGRYVWAGATDRPIPSEADDPVTTDAMELMRPTAPAAPAAPPVAFNRTLQLGTEDYQAVATTKNLIVLHFTAGQSARSAYDTWRADPRRIATAYVVDRDGTIYEMFDPRYWASHLGIKGGAAHDKRSIGIEIANVGPLTASTDGSILNWWVGKPFCGIDEQDKYCAKEYRGYQFYAAFPRPQISAVGELVHHLVERFSVPKVLTGASRRHEYDEGFFASFKGIATHANFRKDKFDIGPAFDWDVL